jgi:hypothetical protein
VETELLLSGEARGAMTAGGAQESRPFTTRLLVRRPVDAARFNGVVLVDWLNVSSGSDFSVLWPSAERLITSDGYAWVGLTTQPVGAGFLRRWDPIRYAAIEHPHPMDDLPPYVFGETLSDGVFEAAGVAMREHGERLFGRTPAQVFGYGQSQSCGRIAGYIGELGTRQPAYDGFLMHSGGASARSSASDPSGPSPLLTNVVPVFHVNSEFEALGGAGRLCPADHEHYRFWEVPGSGHAPVLASRQVMKERLRDHQDLTAGPAATPARYGQPLVTVEYALQAAIDHLTRWATTGAEPPVVDRIAVKGMLAPTETSFGDRVIMRQRADLRRDRHGNAVGGTRLPHVEAPTGRHLPSNDEAQTSYSAGFVPFSKKKLARLYPAHDDYVGAVTESVNAAVTTGVLLPADGDDLVRQAEASTVGG